MSSGCALCLRIGFGEQRQFETGATSSPMKSAGNSKNDVVSRLPTHDFFDRRNSFMFFKLFRNSKILFFIVALVSNATVVAVALAYLRSSLGGSAWQTSLGTLYLVGLVGCLFSALLSLIATQYLILAPLRRLTQFTRDLADGKRFAFEANYETEAEELSLIGRSIREMSLNQQMLLRLVQEASGSVSTSAHSLEGITQRAFNHIGEAVSGINQIAESIDSVSKNTQAAAVSSRQAVKDAQEGRSLVVEMVQVMKDAQFAVTESAGFITALGKRSGQIAKIVDEITRLADQTNVLSLNAAIEAVRAGEAGKGFGVVAAEVGKLAESSAKSAQQVTALMEKVHEETQSAVDRSVKAGRKVTEGYRLIQEMEKRFLTITEEVNQMTYQMQWMADHIDAIAASVKNATASSAEQSAAMEQISSNSKELAQVVEKLRLLIAPVQPKI